MYSKLVLIVLACAYYLFVSANMVLCQEDFDVEMDDEIDDDELEIHLSDVNQTASYKPLSMEIVRQLPLPDRNFSFGCRGRFYGYYADIETSCRYFHICLKISQPGDTAGEDVLSQFSFICPNATVFDQELIECRDPEVSLPCGKSIEFFHLNELFGLGGDDGILEDAVVEKS